jgi:hypothetical protein
MIAKLLIIAVGVAAVTSAAVLSLLTARPH